jgi:hypothetical protein
MTPGVFDFTLVRGSTTPFKVRLRAKPVGWVEGDDYVNIPFDMVHLTVTEKRKPNLLIFRKVLGESGFAITDALTAEITWTPTPVESRSLLVGAKNIYELEVRNGSSQEVYLEGTITGHGGINDDA